MADLRRPLHQSQNDLAMGRKESQDIGTFSETYAEAREKFVASAKRLRAELHTLDVTQDDAGSYTTDVAVVRGTGSGLVVVSSGTHGVEGYAGSAIQISILNQLAERQISVSPTIVLIHAVNPFGMAHFRRWNENNVDLNRNALLPQHFDQLIRNDLLQPTYMNFSRLFNPTTIPSWFYIHISSWMELAWNIGRHGLKQMKTALVAATYTEERGIFYGGRELQRSHVNVRDFMTRHFGHVPADQVGWIDVHTGLGPSGVDVLMGNGADREDLGSHFPAIPGEFDGFQALNTGNTIDDVIRLRCEGSGPQVNASGRVTQSSGYEFTVGCLGCDEWLTQFFKPNSGKVTAVTQEFGTVPGIAVARALIFENIGFQYDRAQHEYWRAMTRDAFYVRRPEWKAKVLTRGHDVFSKFVARAASRSTPVVP